jgi:hypothetical protein
VGPFLKAGLLGTLAVLLLAAPAYAGSDEAIRVNEIAPAAGKVEIVDVFRNESFPPDRPEGYVVNVYDGAGNQLASQPFSPPAVFADPVVLDFSLPADTGQVCFGYAPDPDSTEPPDEYIYHCLGYGNVTKPVIKKRKFQTRGPRYLDTLTPAPGPGESVQRQPCGKGALAAPTLGAANKLVPAACAGLPDCDDPLAPHPPLKPTVTVPRRRDVDRPLFLTVRLNVDGDISLRGSLFTSVGGYAFGPIERELRANKAVRLRIPTGRRARRIVKRAARQGEETRVGFRAVIRDKECRPGRFHSSRVFTLPP